MLLWVFPYIMGQSGPARYRPCKVTGSETSLEEVQRPLVPGIPSATLDRWLAAPWQWGWGKEYLHHRVDSDQLTDPDEAIPGVSPSRTSPSPPDQRSPKTHDPIPLWFNSWPSPGLIDLLVFVNLTQVRVIWKARTSLEKSPLGLACGHVCGTFP